MVAERTIAEIVERVKPAVVGIVALDADGDEESTGTGFLIDAGHVITNWHVVEDACGAQVKLFSGALLEVSGVAASDETADLAILALSKAVENPTVLEVAKKPPRQGDRVVVVGNPLGFDFTVTDGIVSAIRDTPERGRVLQITAPISHGSSGSPVVDMQGVVVGVVRSYHTEGQNLNFAASCEDILGLKTHSPQAFGVSTKGDLRDDPEDPYLEDDEYRRAGAFYGELEYAKALPLYQAVTRRFPSAAGAWISVGHCFRELGRHEEALEAYGQAASVKPAHSDAHTWLGSTYSDLGRYEEAIEAYQQAIRIDPDPSVAYEWMGETYSKLGLHQEAIAAYRQAITTDPDDSLRELCGVPRHDDICERIQEAFDLLGLHDEELEFWRQLVRVTPNVAAAHKCMADACLKLERADEALEPYRRAVSADPDDPFAYDSLGDAYSKLGRHEEALEIYRQLVHLFGPDLPHTYCKMGNACNELGRYEEAMEACRHAIRIEPDLAPAYYCMGNVRRNLGHYEEALEAYRRAIHIYPAFPEARFAIGLAFLGQGNTESALEEYKRLKELDKSLAEKLFAAIYK